MPKQVGEKGSLGNVPVIIFAITVIFACGGISVKVLGNTNTVNELCPKVEKLIISDAVRTEQFNTIMEELGELKDLMKDFSKEKTSD